MEEDMAVSAWRAPGSLERAVLDLMRVRWTKVVRLAPRRDGDEAECNVLAPKKCGKASACQPRWPFCYIGVSTSSIAHTTHSSWFATFLPHEETFMFSAREQTTVCR